MENESSAITNPIFHTFTDAQLLKEVRLCGYVHANQLTARWLLEAALYTWATGVDRGLCLFLNLRKGDSTNFRVFLRAMFPNHSDCTFACAISRARYPERYGLRKDCVSRYKVIPPFGNRRASNGATPGPFGSAVDEALSALK